MKPAGSEAKCRSRPGRRRANGPAPGAGRNKEKKKKEGELRTRDATNNKKIGIGETKTPSKPTAECMNMADTDRGWGGKTVSDIGSFDPVLLRYSKVSVNDRDGEDEVETMRIEEIYPEPGGTLSGNTLNNALNLQNQYHSKIGGPPPPPPPPPPRVPRKGPSRKAKRRAHRFPQEQTQQKEEECATTQEARESQDQERPQWVDDPVWALYRNRKGDETKVYAAMVKCPAPELWITYEDDGSWERIRDENRVRARKRPLPRRGTRAPLCPASSTTGLIDFSRSSSSRNITNRLVSTKKAARSSVERRETSFATSEPDPRGPKPHVRPLRREPTRQWGSTTQRHSNKRKGRRAFARGKEHRLPANRWVRHHPQIYREKREGKSHRCLRKSGHR